MYFSSHNFLFVHCFEIKSLFKDLDYIPKDYDNATGIYNYIL